MTPEDLIIALALVLVIEGSLYALFPDAMRRAIAQALTLPVAKLRYAGVVAATIGVGLVWLMRG